MCLKPLQFRSVGVGSTDPPGLVSIQGVETTAGRNASLTFTMQETACQLCYISGRWVAQHVKASRTPDNNSYQNQLARLDAAMGWNLHTSSATAPCLVSAGPQKINIEASSSFGVQWWWRVRLSSEAATRSRACHGALLVRISDPLSRILQCAGGGGMPLLSSMWESYQRGC